MQSNKIIIVSSGASIPFDTEKFNSDKMGLPPVLKNIIENNYSIGLNSFFKFGCQTTVNFVNDYIFYRKNYTLLKDLPLIVCRDNPQLYTLPKYSLYNNTLVIPDAKYYFGMDSWDINNKKCLVCDYRAEKTDASIKCCTTCKTKLMPIGFYHGHLANIISTTFAIALGFKEVYWLGSDCNETNGKTHFYQDLISDFKEYFGVGKLETSRGQHFRTSAYSDVKKLNEQYYKPLAEEKGVKIYNVSPNSVLTGFEKIDYQTFYKSFEGSTINQDEARNEIKSIMLEKTKC